MLMLQLFYPQAEVFCQGDFQLHHRCYDPATQMLVVGGRGRLEAVSFPALNDLEQIILPCSYSKSSRPFSQHTGFVSHLWSLALWLNNIMYNWFLWSHSSWSHFTAPTCKLRQLSSADWTEQIFWCLSLGCSVSSERLQYITVAGVEASIHLSCKIISSFLMQSLLFWSHFDIDPMYGAEKKSSFDHHSSPLEITIREANLLYAKEVW